MCSPLKSISIVDTFTKSTIYPIASLEPFLSLNGIDFPELTCYQEFSTGSYGCKTPGNGWKCKWNGMRSPTYLTMASWRDGMDRRLHSLRLHLGLHLHLQRALVFAHRSQSLPCGRVRAWLLETCNTPSSQVYVSPFRIYCLWSY